MTFASTILTRMNGNLCACSVKCLALGGVPVLMVLTVEAIIHQVKMIPFLYLEESTSILTATARFTLSDSVTTLN